MMGMLRDGGRYCDGCGQKLPPSAKLAQETVSAEAAREFEMTAPPNADGTVTIDLCLMCRIRRAKSKWR
jgi:hypothetical protein